MIATTSSISRQVKFTCQQKQVLTQKIQVDNTIIQGLDI